MARKIETELWIPAGTVIRTRGHSWTFVGKKTDSAHYQFERPDDRPKRETVVLLLQEAKLKRVLKYMKIKSKSEVHPKNTLPNTVRRMFRRYLYAHANPLHDLTLVRV